MNLSPVPKKPKIAKRKTVTWNDKQLAVTKLLDEASALIDIFDEMSMVLGPEVKLKNTAPISKIDILEIPKSKWDPILTASCNALQNTISNFKPHKHLTCSEILSTGN